MHSLKEESGKFRADVLGKDEAAVREIFASPHSSAEERGEVYLGYLRKAEAFRTSNGATPEQNAAWRKAFSASLANDTMRTKYERLVQENPDVALRILNMALGDGKPSDSAPGSGSGAGPGAGYDPEIAPMTSPADPQVDPQAERERQLAAEYAKSFTPERLRSLKNQAEIGVDKARRETDERVSMAYAKTGSAMLQAMESGKLDALQQVEDELHTLGKTDDAQQIASMRKLVELVQPHLALGRFDSFDQQKAAIEKLFSSSLMRGMGNGTGQMSADRALDLARRGANALIDKWQDQHRRDPAGYVLSHPQLGEEGMSTEEFCTRKGLTLEQHISSSLRMQERMEKSIGAPSSGISPRVLTEAQAARIKDDFAALTDPREQAAFARKLSKDNGRYAKQVMAEAGLPPGMTAFSEVMPGLAESEVAKLAQASGTNLEAMNLPPERMASIRQHVGEFPMAKWMLFADQALSGSERTDQGSAGPGNADQAIGQVGAEVVRTMEVFVALGGNLPDLQRRMVLDKTWLAGEMLARAATLKAMRVGEQIPNTDMGEQLAAERGDTPFTPNTSESGKSASKSPTDLDESIAAANGQTVDERFVAPTNSNEMAEWQGPNLRQDWSKESMQGQIATERGEVPPRPEASASEAAKSDSVPADAVSDFGPVEPAGHPQPDRPLDEVMKREFYLTSVSVLGAANGFLDGWDPVYEPLRSVFNILNDSVPGDPDYLKSADDIVLDLFGPFVLQDEQGKAVFTSSKDGTEVASMICGFGAVGSLKSATKASKVIKISEAERKAAAAAKAAERSATKEVAENALPHNALNSKAHAAEGNATPGKAAAEEAAHLAGKSKPPRKVSRPMGHSPEEFAAYVRNNKEAAVQQYIEDFGHHLNLDEARKYCGAYAESVEGARAHTLATNDPAGELVRTVYEHLLKQPTKPGQQNRVVLGAGAAGSGKSSSLFDNPDFADFLGASHLTYDTTLAGPWGLPKIDQALNAGKDVDIYFVVRDPLEAIMASVIRATEEGRFIPLDAVVNMHLSARDNVRKAMEVYAGDKRVKIRFLDNTGPRPARLTDASLLDKQNYTDLHKRAQEALETEYNNGTIPEELYRRIRSGTD